MKRRKHPIYVAIIVVLAFGIGWQFIPFTPTEQDVAKAKEIVLKQKTEPPEEFSGAELKDNGVLEITTRWAKAPLEGGGHTYYLRKIFGSWRMCKTEVWNN